MADVTPVCCCQRDEQEPIGHLIPTLLHQCAVDLETDSASTPGGSRSFCVHMYKATGTHLLAQDGITGQDSATASEVGAGAGPPVPVLTITSRSGEERARQHAWFLQHRDRLHAVKEVRFFLHADRDKNKVTLMAGGACPEVVRDFEICKDDNGLGLLAWLHEFLRESLLDVWRAMDPALATVTGSFETFSPGLGTNIQWHQDGWTPSCYLAHYYINHTLDRTMDWFEVSLPPHSEAHEEAGANAGGSGAQEVEEDTIMGFMSDDGMRVNGVNTHNFLPLPMAGQPLMVFEDAEVYHRTPLTALACPAIRASRSIVRMDFYGRYGDGRTALFRSPAGARLQRHQGEVGGTVFGTWAPLDQVSLPMGLWRICHEYAARQPQQQPEVAGQQHGQNQQQQLQGPGKGRHCHDGIVRSSDNTEAFSQALEAYVVGTADIRAQMGELVAAANPSIMPRRRQAEEVKVT